MIKNKKYFIFFGFLLTLLNLRFTFISGAQHDYAAVLNISKEIINGANPWNLHGNFYGPLLWALSYLTKFHDLLPKIINFLMWNGALLIILNKTKKNFFIKFFIFCLFNSPNFWIEIFKFGHFEGVLAFLAVSSLMFYQKKRYFISGFLIGLSICFKLTTLIIVPFLIFISFSKKNFFKVKINYNFLIGLFFTMITIYFFTIILYDFNSVTNLIRIGFVKSEHMSIFRFLRGEFSPFPLITLDILSYKKIEVISFISYPIILLCFFVIFYRFLDSKIDLKNSLLFITLLVPFLYKSGYAQYYTLHFIILFYYFADLRKVNIEKFVEKYLILLLPLFFVTYFNFIYAYEFHIYNDSGQDPVWGGGNFGFLKIQEWAGLLSLFFIIPALIFYYKNKFKIK